MKLIRTVALIASLAAVALPASAFAGTKGKHKAEEQPAGPKAILKKYDTNGNGVIDQGAEADALRKAFETDKSLKAVDTNKDGKLDDTEIAAIKPKHHGGKKKKA